MNQITIDDLGGTPPGAKPRSRVLENFKIIGDARARGWSWGQIGEAIGLSGDAVRKAHERVRRAIDAGRIDPEALGSPRPAPEPSPSARPEQRPAAGWQGWKTLGNQNQGDDR